MLLFIIIWVLLLLSSTANRKINVVLFAILLFALAILSGLRAESVGTDTGTYKELMGYIANGRGEYIEKGWLWVNEVVLFWEGGFTALLVVTSILVLGPVAYVIAKASPNPMLSLFFYYSMYLYLNSFNMMRQAVAISFVFLGFYFLTKRKDLYFFLSLLAGCLFHASALVAILYYMFYKVSFKDSLTKWMLVSTLIVGLLAAKASILSLVLGPYAVYLESDVFGYRPSIALPLIMTLLLNALYYFVDKTHRSVDKIWLKLFMFSVLLTNLTFQLALGTRIVLFFSISQVILFPLYLKNNKIKEKNLVFTLVIVYFSLIFFKILMNNGSDVFPYKFFFNN